MIRGEGGGTAVYLQKPLSHFTLPGYDVITFSCTFPVWCKVTKYLIITFNSPDVAAASEVSPAQHVNQDVLSFERDILLKNTRKARLF